MVQRHEHLSHMLPVQNGQKQGDAYFTFFCQLCCKVYQLEGQEKGQGLKLNGMYHTLV